MGDLITSANITNPRLLARADLPLLISAASQMIETHCNRTFALNTAIVEWHDGKDVGRLFLRQPPVQAVTAINLNGEALDNTDQNGWTFRPDTGELRRGPPWGSIDFCSVFSEGSQNVQVTYSGGYSPIPPAVILACVQQVKHMADLSKDTGLYKSEQIGDWRMEINPDALDWSPLALRLIEPFVL